MKRIILAVSMMVLALGTNAQREVGSLTFQPKLGLNISGYTDEGDIDTSPRLGLVAGGEFEYQATEMLGLAVGLVYSAQGEKAKANGVTLTLQADYFNIPIIANLYVAKGLALKFGIQPGFNVKSMLEAKNNGMKVSGSISDLGYDLKSFDFAIPVGISYEHNNFVVDGRYNIGVSKVMDGDDSRNRVFQFTIGYKFTVR